MHITLGTANFGINYGLFNTKVKFQEFKKIKEIIEKRKINFFDTSINYHLSESIIGNLKLDNKKIITKISLPQKKIYNYKKWLFSTIQNSLKKLKIKKLYGVLLHDANDILLNKKNIEFLEVLNEAKKKKNYFLYWYICL